MFFSCITSHPFFPISNRWNKLFFYFIIHTSLWLSLSLSLSHSLATALPLSLTGHCSPSLTLSAISLSFSHGLNLHEQTQAVLLLPQTTVHHLFISSLLCITGFISLSFFFSSPWGIQGQNHSLSPLPLTTTTTNGRGEPIRSWS